MKKNFKMIFAAAAAFAMVLSCSKEANPSQGTQGSGSADSLTPITISATLTDNMTKVSFTPSYDGGKPQNLALAWEAEDKLRVYNHDDRTQCAVFEIAEESIGQKTGSFTGEIFTAASYDVEIINGEVGYAEQTQPADGETASLKYLASATGVTDLKAVVFNEQSSVLAITALMPEGAAGGVTSVELSASEAIFSTGKTLTINLAQKGDAGDDGILHLFATLPVGDQQIAEGTTLFVRFNAPKTDHTVYTRYVELGAQAFEAGKLNTINVNASQSDKHAGLTSCDGTAEKAYLIGDKYQLNAMSGLVSADATTHFAMVADVDFGGSAWTSASGKVAFEGNDHKISNVVAAGGLFASLSGSVQNLTFDKVKVTKTSNDSGVLADVTDASAVIKNITVTESSIQGKDDVGGLVGRLYGSVEDAVIDCEVSGSSRIGGLAGSLLSGSLKGNTSSGNVTSKYQTVGGLVGQMEGGSISACSASGDVTHDYSALWSNASGFVGRMTGGTITSSHATGDVIIKVKGSGVGGLIGVLEASTTLIDNYYEGTITGPASTNNVGGLIGNLGGSHTVKIEGCHSSGTLTVQAGNVGGLLGQVQNTSTTLSDCYSTADVSSTGSAGGLIARSAADITATGCYATGNVTSSGCAGGLIGEFKKGKVEKCHATGQVSSAGNCIGGLIGLCQAEDMNICDSYATGNVTTTSGIVGGLIGEFKKGTVENCYALGHVESGQNCTGGLIGLCQAGDINICESYATGNVTSSGVNTGGLIGEFKKGKVERCYAEGKVEGSTSNFKGGLIGSINGGPAEISDSYSSGSVICSSYSAAFIGTHNTANVTVTNCYTKSKITGENYGGRCVFSSSKTEVTVTGFIGWDVSKTSRWAFEADSAVPTDCYMGTEGTISEKATGFGWNPAIWDLSKDDPKLKWTLPSNN